VLEATPSSTTSLQRAARQERARIAAERTRIQDRIGQLRAELDSLVRVDRDLNDQARLLDEVMARDTLAVSDSEKVVLRGAALREQALQVLVTRVGIRQVIGYRDWYRLVREAGFIVLAKRPIASFLTTVSRSPLVRKGTEPGTYYIEPGVADDLRQELAEHRAELRDLEVHLASRPSRESPLQRHRLNLMATVRRLERQVAEAERILRAHHDAVFDSAQRAA
jgi:hypothetical protein